MKIITKNEIRNHIEKNFKYISMDSIREVLDNNNIGYKSNSKKAELISLIKDNGIDLIEFTKYLGFTKKEVKELFMATDNMVKKMEETNFITRTKGKRINSQVAGKIIELTMYDIEKIYKITDVQYNKWLEKNLNRKVCK